MPAELADQERERLTLEPNATHPEVGRWLSAMEWARHETMQTLEGVTDDIVDRRIDGDTNTIGTLLYHVALVEADWLLEDVFEGTMPWPDENLPFGDRDPEGILTEVQGMTLKQHLDRLTAIRTMFTAAIKPMSVEDFHRTRARDRFHVSPAWVLYHLIDHEAEHRSQIARLRDQAE
jgi:uncharacterized damage-inducible protein DinB